jgi:hypothetical protein
MKSGIMQSMISKCVLPLSVMMLGWPAVAHSATVYIAVEPASKFDEDIDVVTKFLVPNGLNALNLSACQHSYRTKLETTPSDQELEQFIPGIHDVMVDAAVRYCNKEMPIWLSAKQAEVRGNLKGELGISNAAKLSNLLADAVAAMEKVDVSVRQGETAGAAVDRAVGGTMSWEREFNLKFSKFMATPSNKNLWGLVERYQAQLAIEFESSEKGSASVLLLALSHAQQAANEYAESEGFGPPYP